MDKGEFEKYVSDRYQAEIDWYNKKAVQYKSYYTLFQVTLIILAAISPVLVGIQQNYSDNSYLKVITIVSTAIVAIITASIKTFKLQENWINYRTTCETLKKEIFLYRVGSNDYSSSGSPEKIFVERVESLISRENTLWLTSYKKENSNEELSKKQTQNIR